MDLQKSYASLFELLWYSQMPCYDILNVTTVAGQDSGELYAKCMLNWYEILLNICLTKNNNNNFIGMIRDCIWKGKRLSCSAIFTKQPTDQGMCCSFNKERADEMFKESRYREQIEKLSDQDKTLSAEDSALPDWQV